MGTGHVLLHYKLLKRLERSGQDHSKFFTITRAGEFCDGIAQCVVESPLLPEGYNGQQEMGIEWNGEKVVSVKFRRETDT